MKLSYIIAIGVIAVAIGILIITAGDASTYVDFSQAQQLASDGNTTPIHVVGQLKKDDAGNVVGLEKSIDNLSFSFILVDENHREQKVFYNEPMPADLLRSEKVVVIGNYNHDQFIAKKILLKCPSKYQEQKLKAGV
jgi:cytochrome c-type biogenesis protein CcmE